MHPTTRVGGCRVQALYEAVIAVVISHTHALIVSLVELALRRGDVLVAVGEVKVYRGVFFLFPLPSSFFLHSSPVCIRRESLFPPLHNQLSTHLAHLSSVSLSSHIVCPDVSANHVLQHLSRSSLTSFWGLPEQRLKLHSRGTTSTMSCAWNGGTLTSGLQSR